MTSDARILLPNQLFPSQFIKEKDVVVSDHMWFTDEKPFNKITLAHKFISSLAYANQHKYKRFWIGDKSKIGPFTRACRYLKKQKINLLRIFDPIDKPLIRSIESICKKEKISLIIDDTPAFLESHEDLDDFLRKNPPKKRKRIHSYSHTPFYKWQRERLDLLMTKDGTYIGGKLTYDTQNRQPFPKNTNKDPTNISPLPLPKGVSASDVETILTFIHKRYKHNPGSLPTKGGEIGSVAFYPMDNTQALNRLRRFLKELLPEFGPYEDAINPNVSFGYHSVLSSSLNNGLLTPKQVLDEIQKEIKGKTLKGPYLASVEGFIRQVFGWRSYCRLIYREERDVMMRSNYMRHTKKLPKSWFSNSKITTHIPWLDTMFEDAYDKAYAHHIVRLMVFSQWFLLMRFHPRDVLDWFWSVVSIDAYEWVMVPNVLGMGQYADGGIMMTRPYISSSTYLEKMSRNTLKGCVKIGKKEYQWQEIWRSLYYDFLHKHTRRIGKQYAYATSYSRLNKMNTDYKDISKKYREL